MKNTASLLIMAFLVLFGCPAARADNGGVENVSAKHTYTLHAVHPVAGRQGICAEDGFYWVSGSTTLTKYDKEWKVVAENTDPFKGYELEVNHIGDIDVYRNELYLGVEYFMDGVGKTFRSPSMTGIRWS